MTHVLPNGYLVLEGTKDVLVNSEHQMVTVRGVIRPADLTAGNIISSNQIAQMEIKHRRQGRGQRCHPAAHSFSGACCSALLPF